MTSFEVPTVLRAALLAPRRGGPAGSYVRGQLPVGTHAARPSCSGTGAPGRRQPVIPSRPFG